MSTGPFAGPGLNVEPFRIASLLNSLATVSAAALSYASHTVAIGASRPPRLITGSAKNSYVNPFYLDRRHGKGMDFTVIAWAHRPSPGRLCVRSSCCAADQVGACLLRRCAVRNAILARSASSRWFASLGSGPRGEVPVMR
jgi:hypothetical protein